MVLGEVDALESRLMAPVLACSVAAIMIIAVAFTSIQLFS